VSISLSAAAKGKNQTIPLLALRRREGRQSFFLVFPPPISHQQWQSIGKTWIIIKRYFGENQITPFIHHASVAGQR
jgi:hypothetical protein